MSFLEELKQALIGAESPSTSYQMYDQKRKQEEKELEQANNPAGKNIVIPADYLRYSKEGLKDGNIVDDYIGRKYIEGIPNSRADLIPGTNVVVNPITGLASGLGRGITEGGYNNIYYMKSSYYPINRLYQNYYRGPQTRYPQSYEYEYLDPDFNANRTLSVNNVVSPDVNNTPIVPQYKPQPEVQQEPAKESANNRRTAYNQARGITTAEAYKRQKALRDAGYNITYDGYWGDASNKAWNEYQKKLQQPQTPQMPAQFANVDIMGAIKAEEARKKSELEALMQQQGAGSELLNTDPHNIQGGYVVPVEPQYDMSKMDTHNQFGLKFYKGGMVPKHQNASGEELKEKPRIISVTGPNYNETMVSGTDSTGTNKYQFREVEQQGDTTKVLYMRDPKTGQIIAVPADSRFNKDYEWMVRNAEPINEYKKGGSLKKCSCGCKTLLKKGKGGKVMESRNCK